MIRCCVSALEYKDLIFIDYPNIMIKPGLRKEIIQLRKTKDQFFYFNKNKPLQILNQL